MSTLDPDRLFPSDPATREIARDLYAAVADASIISPHGHVAPQLLASDAPFTDPAALFITHDHYVTRLLHAAGVSLDALGVGGASAEPREVWRTLCRNWHLFYGTASGYWLTHTFSTLFGIDDEPSAENADALYERIAARLGEDAFRPRALFAQFRIEVLATTDDPLDDLALHAALAAPGALTGRVLPTFRPDRFLDPDGAGFADAVAALADHHGTAVDDFRGYLDALADRRDHFIRHGAVSTDHGVLEPYTVALDEAEAAALYRQAVAGTLDAAGARAFRGHMLVEMARMSARDGLVMTLHAGVLRNHSQATFAHAGPDTGHDIPVRTEYTTNLRPLLNEVGLDPNFRMILFGVDETAFSRDIAPLAGFYPSVYVGAPWWFLDAPDAVQRFRAAVTETAGFYRGSGFIDDTRAFLSIPARHDMARRSDAAFLARLVREGRMRHAQAERVARDLVDRIPREAFRL